MATLNPDFITGRGYYLDTDSSSYGVYADASIIDQPHTPTPPDVPLLFQPSWDSTWPFPFQVSMRVDWDTNQVTVTTPWHTNTVLGDTRLNGFALVGIRCNYWYGYNDMTVGYKDGSGVWHYYTDTFNLHTAGWYLEGGSFPGTPFPVHGDVYIRSGMMNYPASGTATHDSWRVVDMNSVSPHGVYIAGTIAAIGPGPSANGLSYGHSFSYYTSMINGYAVALPPVVPATGWSIGPDISGRRQR